LKRLPWSVTCLSPARQQGELFATQNPDGSLVFSAVLKDEQGSLSFLLVPPSAQLVDWSLETRLASRRRVHPVRRSGAAGHRLQAMRQTRALQRDEARG
jgi:hypothetical protein